MAENGWRDTVIGIGTGVYVAWFRTIVREQVHDEVSEEGRVDEVRQGGAGGVDKEAENGDGQRAYAVGKHLVEVCDFTKSVGDGVGGGGEETEEAEAEGNGFDYAIGEFGTAKGGRSGFFYFVFASLAASWP